MTKRALKLMRLSTMIDELVANQFELDILFYVYF